MNANSVTLQNGATVSASSTGPDRESRRCRQYHITATNGLTMQNSAITTQAGAGGKRRQHQSDHLSCSNGMAPKQQVSAPRSLTGTGGGGNISIDPQFVILQNSQILAQAAQGQGGRSQSPRISFCRMPIVSSSQIPAIRVNGTVTIQSPNAPGSGQVQPLGKTPLLPTSLLNQHCASLAGGEFSSFTVAGRDSLPTEPGSWLASPLATLSAGRAGADG